MNRPIYENAHTLALESALAYTVENALEVKLEKQPRHFVLDYAAMRDNEVVGFVELKNRQYRHDSFEYLIVSTTKLIRAKELKTVTGMDTILVVQFENCVLCHRFDFDSHYKLTLGGRKDRKDNEDIEACVKIPLSKFKFLPSPKKKEVMPY